MNTSNPTLTEKAFSSVGSATDRPMTVQGAINKTAILLAFLCIPAIYTWKQAHGNPAAAGGWIAVGAIVGFILCLVTCFKKEWSSVTAPLYAVAEGLFLGAVSAVYENAAYPGIVLQAVVLTMGTLGFMLGLYTLRIVQPTQKFVLGVFAATGAIALFYLVTIVLSLFHVPVPFTGGGAFSIGFSVVVVVIAALNLIIDFGVIEQGAANSAPKYMEWYAGFGLLVTLVWLYLEILRLLSKLAKRD